MRKTIDEPVFGQIKAARGLDHFLLRGLEKVKGEWHLIAIAHNLGKLHRAALRWRHEPDAAVAVLIVVPGHECRHQGANLFHAAEWPPRSVRPVLQRAQQRF